MSSVADQVQGLLAPTLTRDATRRVWQRPQTLEGYLRTAVFALPALVGRPAPPGALGLLVSLPQYPLRSGQVVLLGVRRCSVGLVAARITGP
jgi:hypothetical protein